MAGVLQHLRSSTLNKRPNPASMVDGQIAINYASGSPGAFFKDTNGNLVKVGPVHVGATAPNVSPASGGTAGNSLGEQWLDTSGGTYVFKIWDGAAWRSEAGEFVNSTGDTMTGSLTMGPSANLIFEGSTDDGFETTLTVVDPTADRTITLPNVSGTVVTTGDSGTVTSTMIADGTIVNADVNASAAIAGTKISPDFGSQTIQTTGVFSHALGSASSPTVTFTGDTNTGIYSPGADQVAISTGGSGRLFVDASGNIGLGTSAPNVRLDVTGTARIGTSGSVDFTLDLGRSGVGTTRSAFLNGNSGNVTFSNQENGFLSFHTNNTERLRITSAGLVGVGTSSPVAGSLLDVAGGAVACNKFLWNRISSTEATATRGLLFTIDGTDYGRIYSPNGKSVAIQAGGGALTDALTIDTTGRVGIGTTSPSYLLDVAGTARIGATTGDATLEIGTGASANRNAYIDLVGDTTYTDYGTRIIRQGGGANADSRIQHRGTGALALETAEAGASIVFLQQPGERARIDSSGRLLVGTSSSFQGGAIEVAGLAAVGSAGNDAFSTALVLSKTRGATVNSQTIVQNGDELGSVIFRGSDGSAYRPGAFITAAVDGTPGANDMPGRLVFSTTADGASSPTERLRITSAGNVGIGTTSPGELLSLYKDTNPFIGIQNSTTGTASTDGGYVGMAGLLMQITNKENAPIAFLTNNTERARIDSSGRLLVGTSSAAQYNHFSNNIRLQIAGTDSSTSSVQLTSFENSVFAANLILSKSRSGTIGVNTIVQNGDRLGTISFNGADGSGFPAGAIIEARIDGTPSANDLPTRLEFSTTSDGASSPTERMRISSAGVITLGGGAAATNGAITLYPNDFAGTGFFDWNRVSTATSANALRFKDGAVTVGSVTYTNTATAYNTSSDYRLKENVAPVTDGITRLQQLKPSRFNFIADPDKTVDGFLAHEVQTIVPEAITGEKDAVDDDGNPIYQGIDQSKLVPLLTAALQEAIGEIESLKARLTAAGI